MNDMVRRWYSWHFSDIGAVVHYFSNGFTTRTNEGGGGGGGTDWVEKPIEFDFRCSSRSFQSCRRLTFRQNKRYFLVTWISW